MLLSNILVIYHDWFEACLALRKLEDIVNLLAFNIFDLGLIEVSSVDLIVLDEVSLQMLMIPCA